MPPTLTVTIEYGKSDSPQYTLKEPFRIGRHPDCAIRLHDEVVSRQHAEVFIQDGQWWIRDLQSANGVFVDGQRVESAPLADIMRIQLGASGPSFFLAVESPPQPRSPLSQPATPQAPAKQSSGEPHSLRHYKDHYFGKTGDPKAGEHTIMVRRAFAEVQKKQRRIYVSIIGSVLVLLVVTGAVALYKHRQVVKQRKLASEIFYTMRALEIDLVKLRAEAEQRRSVEARKQIEGAKSTKRQLERSYDRYVEMLDVYRKDMSEEERLILRMAHSFGECEVNMPKGFVKEVNKYIERWRSSERLRKVIRRAERKGYIPKIVRAMDDHDLPPQFLYLGIQESNLNQRAVGPPTRFGIAKGMWQFIPSTAEKYGLRTGPLKDEAVVDLQDERHDFTKSTQAAARYLRDIYTTDAQASGLLVMASYNWGEHRVIKLIQSMPENPRERNFWELISKYRNKIPDETYDYVFLIFSAAVIGQNPSLFGFDFENPLKAGTRKTLSSDMRRPSQIHASVQFQLASVHPETLHLRMFTVDCFQFGNCQFCERSRRSRNYAETYSSTSHK